MPGDTDYDIKNMFLHIGEGNEFAFRAAFDFYKKRFYASALKMTHSCEISEEIVQEVFVNLWIKRARVAASVNPEAYLFAMLHNVIYGHFRKLVLEKAMKKKMKETYDYVDASPVEDKLFAKQDREMFESIISQLPSQQRIIYKLSRQEGLSRQEIASHLHISPHTVKNHLLQAVRFICVYYKSGTSVFIWLAIYQCF